MRLFPVLVVGAIVTMLAGCSGGTQPGSSKAFFQALELTKLLNVQSGFIAAAADPLPNTVRVKRTDTVEASALLKKICGMNKDQHWGIQRVRIYPMDRADWTEAASLPELEGDCP